MNSITNRLLLFIGAVFVATSFGLLYLANGHLTGIIDRYQKEVYTEKLGALRSVLERKYQRLLATGMVEAYKVDFQDSALKYLRDLHYQTSGQEIYPFIMAGDGEVLLHPVLPRGDRSLAVTPYMQDILAVKEGDINYTYTGGVEKWCIFQYFPQWDWIVCYAIPLQVKYSAAYQFRNYLILVMGLGTLFVLFVLFAVVTRFTRPISTLTRAASQMADGNLSEPIDTKGTDEVGVLARSFVAMRAAIEQQIADLGTTNRKLQLEIKERQFVESALRESEERFRGLVAHIPGATYRSLHDVKRTMLFISKMIEEISGYPACHFIQNESRTYASIIHQNDRKLVADTIHAALCRRQPFSVDYRIVDLKGNERWVTERGRGVFLENEELLNIDGVIFDITERKHNEAQLARLALAIEQGAEEVVITDAQGMIQYVNPAFERITGYHRSEAIGCELLFNKSKAYDDFFCDVIRQSVKENGLWAGRLDTRKKDGSIIQEDTTVSSVSDADGNSIGFVAVKRDVTEQIKIEERIRQTQKMEAIGTLAGGIAHDFNNILFGIIGYSELILRESRKLPELHNMVGRVLEGANRAKNLVKQILTFSRQREVVLQPVQLKLIVKEALTLLKPALHEGIEVKQNIVTDHFVKADPTQLHQVFVNLCTNANYAMRKSGGTLEIALLEVTLDDDFVRRHPEISAGRYVQLIVSDSGCGMCQEEQDRIFEPFYTSKPEGEGTGLGLSTVHGIVKGIGGTISLYSEPGVGSTFNVFFPTVMEECEPETADYETLPTGSERILLVDDEVFLVQMLSAMLTDLGYEVAGTCSSEEALQAFLEEPDRFDLVLTDMTMPKLNGLGLAQAVLTERPEMPVILCTGFSLQVNEEEAKAAGIRELLMKPVLKKDLAHSLRRALTLN